MTQITNVKDPDPGDFELFEMAWVDWDDLSKMVRSGEIRNQFVLAAYAKVVAYLGANKG